MPEGNVKGWIDVVMGFVTASGVIFAGVQLLQTQRQEQTAFEDKLAEYYRELIKGLPLEVFYGSSLGADVMKDHLPVFFRYFTLTNDQIYLRHKNKISADAWEDWIEGIRGNMSKAAFKDAWKELGPRLKDSFHQLRRLEAQDWKGDPKQWSRESLPSSSGGTVTDIASAPTPPDDPDKSSEAPGSA